MMDCVRRVWGQTMSSDVGHVEASERCSVKNMQIFGGINLLSRYFCFSQVQYHGKPVTQLKAKCVCLCVWCILNFDCTKPFFRPSWWKWCRLHCNQKICIVVSVENCPNTFLLLLYVHVPFKLHCVMPVFLFAFFRGSLCSSAPVI